MAQEKKAEPLLAAGDDFFQMFFYGTVKNFNTERGFGWLNCADTTARFGREVYLSKEEATALAKDLVVGTQFSEAEPVRDGQFVRFKVTQGEENYPLAIQTRRVRRLLGEVMHLPGEQAADGILTVKGDPHGSTDSLQQLMGKEVRIRQSDCGQLRLHIGDEVTFYCILIGDNPPMLEGKVAELRSTNRTPSTLMGCVSMEIPRALEPAKICAHALPDRIVLAGIPEGMDKDEIRNIFSEFEGQEVIVTHDDADCDRFGFASVSFPGVTHVGRVLLRSFVAIAVGNMQKVVRMSIGARAHEEFGKSLPMLPALPRPVLESEEPKALMVRWSQVSLAAGYLVELRPVNGGVPGAWSSVDVAAGSVEKGSKLPPGLLGPQCSACRVNKLKEVPYEARISYFTICGCRSQSSQVSALCYVQTSQPQTAPIPRLPLSEGSMPAIKTGDGPDWRAPSGNLIPSPAAPELISLEEPGGGRGILVQWPTVVHATAYVVELYEENAASLECFHRNVPENLKEVLVELRVGNLQPGGSYSACVKAIAPCGFESQRSPWSVAPAWYPSYLQPQGGWGHPPPMLHNGSRSQAAPPGPSPLLSTNLLAAPLPPVELPPDPEHEALPDLGGTAVEAAALVLD